MIDSMEKISYIDEEILRDICHKLAIKYFTIDGEPIGDYELRDNGKIASALENPQRSFGGVELYPTLYHKAAILYYGMIKAHAFANGNKRIAVVTLLTFLAINDKYLKVAPEVLESNVVEVAESPSGEMDKTLAKLFEFLERNCVPFSEAEPG